MILGFKTHYPKYMTKGGQETFFEKKIKSGEKIHSIRKGNRWKAGMIIHAANDVRTKRYNNFSTMVCISVQNIEIKKCNPGIRPVIFIDDVNIDYKNLELLSRNDGLESFQDFKEWFKSGEKNFVGQIIHWTNFKYLKEILDPQIDPEDQQIKKFDECISANMRKRRQYNLVYRLRNKGYLISTKEKTIYFTGMPSLINLNCLTDYDPSSIFIYNLK